MSLSWAALRIIGFCPPLLDNRGYEIQPGLQGGGGGEQRESLIRLEEINFIHFRFIEVHTYWQMSRRAIKPSYSSNLRLN